MSFLTIPGQEGLFRTIRTGKSGEDAEGRSPMDAEGGSYNDDDDEDYDTDNVRLIPRCSPVPRKRGQSINDETAEYIRIHLGLAAGKKVLFADTTGGDLVDVKEFVAFDSDDEEASARWEEEEAKYRKAEREPIYQVHPEFSAPVGGALLQAVRARKLEVERLSPVENEPLAVSGVVRVLNISFQKSVYIRSTMDSWATYFDHPAEYVQGSHDGTTDQFSFKLSFAPPYITHGSRIEFVVRYETADGDYWANNSSMNYVVALHLSYEDDSAQTKVDMQDVRSILKPPKNYSMEFDTDSEDEPEKEQEKARSSNSGLVRPRAECPVIIQPEIDLEIAAHPPAPSVPPNPEPPSVDGTLSAHTVLPGEQCPCTSSETTPQSTSSSVPGASQAAQPIQPPPPSPRPHCELGNPPSEPPTGGGLSASTTAPLQQQQAELLLSSHHLRADGEEPAPSEASERSLRSEEAPTETPTRHPRLELPPERVASPSLPGGGEPKAATGWSSELVDGLSEGLAKLAPRGQSTTSTPSAPVAESRASPKGAAADEASPPPPPSLPPPPPPPPAAPPELAETAPESPGVPEVSQSSAPQSVSPREEKGNASQNSPGTLMETAPNVQSHVPAAPPEYDLSREVIPTAVFLSGVVSLSIVLQEPSTLFLIGLLLVLHRL